MAASKAGQILCIGGEFLVEAWERPLMQEYLLGLAGKDAPSVCIISDASRDRSVAFETHFRQFSRTTRHVDHFSTYDLRRMDFERYFKEFDLIYVPGGSTRNLLAIWREWGIDRALESAWRAGGILAGTSAGAICWFEGCISAILPEKCLALRATGLLAGSCCTHYGSRPDRPHWFEHYLKSGTIPGVGYGIDDGAAAHFIGNDLARCVTAQAGSVVRRLTSLADGLTCETLVMETLGSNESAAYLAPTSH